MATVAEQTAHKLRVRRDVAGVVTLTRSLHGGRRLKLARGDEVRVLGKISSKTVAVETIEPVEGRYRQAFVSEADLQ